MSVWKFSLAKLSGRGLETERGLQSSLPPSSLIERVGSSTRMRRDSSEEEIIKNESHSLYQVNLGIWMTLGAIEILWGVRLWMANTVVPLLVFPGVIAILWGLGILIWHGGPERSRFRTIALYGSLVIVLASFLFWAYFQILQNPAYGTDEMAFDQYAAQLFMHGVNPYLHSMAPSFNLFQVNPNSYTWMVTGQPVTSLSYPALSFLLYVPFMALGVYSELAVWVNTFAWAITVAIAFFMTPKSSRAFVLIVSSLSIYITYAVGGVTDVLFLPFLVVVAYTWERFVSSSSLWRFAIPILFGISMSVKQTPWLLLPFVLIGVGWEKHYRDRSVSKSVRTAGSFLAISVVTFIVTNLPFDLETSVSWFKGITTPFFGGNVPAGEGLISLTLFLHLGGGSLFAFTLLGGLTLVVMMGLLLFGYSRLKSWLFLMPCIPLAFTSRSFASYLVMLVLPAFVAQHNAIFTAPTSLKHKGRALYATVGSIGLIGLVGLYALTRSSPLSVTISSIHTTGQLASVDTVQLSVRNESRQTVNPKFTADEGGSLTSFWQVLSGPKELKPLQSASYTIAAPNYYAMPSLVGGFQMVAFTSAGGAAISHSGAFIPTQWHLALNPDAVAGSVPYGHNVTFTAQIVDRYDRPVDVAGVAVYMGQIIYAQRGLIYGEATINSSNAGQTPILAITNRAGQATFTVTDLLHESDPTYFEANLVDSTTFYPYGYSQIVPVRFQ